MTDVTVPAKGKFVKGISGNPSGRPKGSKNAITLVKLQVEGELRAAMKDDMQAVLQEIVQQALPSQVPRVDPKTGLQVVANGKPVFDTIRGDKEMLKLLYKSWVSGTKATDEEAPKERVQIIIGKLDQTPAVNGTVYPQSTAE